MRFSFWLDCSLSESVLVYGKIVWYVSRVVAYSDHLSSEGRNLVTKPQNYCQLIFIGKMGLFYR